MIEYEIKLKADLNRTRVLLEGLSAKFIGTEQSNDSYYSHPQRDFKSTDEALRIRKTTMETNRSYTLTYKGPKFDSRSKSRKEYNVPYNEGDMTEILVELGFKSVGIVNKIRETWIFEDVLISLDDIENLGSYVELEYNGSDSDTGVIIEYLRTVARKLKMNPDEQIPQSYLELLKMKDQNL
ncbi:MAG: class IV adenylate cyclase [Candidatus Kariarchaeaceae archaeon]